MSKRYTIKLERLYKRVAKGNLPCNMLKEIMADESPMARIVAAKHSLRLGYEMVKTIGILMELSKIKYADAALRQVGYEARELVNGVGDIEIV